MSGKRLLWLVSRSLIRLTFLLAFRVRIFGQLNVPQTGGVLIVSNHQSYLDPLLLAFGLERSSSFMARRTLFRNAAFGWLIASLNAFPVTRGGLDVPALREAVSRLQDGWCLVVFPEGTRTETGAIGPLKPGVLAIAERAGVPIVPAVVQGVFEAWPRGGRVRPHPIAVSYGRPIGPAECRRLGREGLVARIRADMLRRQRDLRRRDSRR